MRTVFFSDHAGQEYAGIDRVVGVILCDPVPVHDGLRGFMSPQIVLPTVQVVTHRQVISREREERRKRGREAG